MGSVFVDSTISDDARRTRLYAGDIFILSPTDGTRSLIDLVRRYAERSICTARPKIDP